MEQAPVTPGQLLPTEHMIPAKVHYVWFGGRPLPAEMRSIIGEWKQLMPDHEVFEWNEGNIDLGTHPWMARMHAQGKYAFASDYARLMILYEHGGIYLDTDVRMKKGFQPFMSEQCLWSFEFDSFLSTAVIAVAPRHPLIAKLMTLYDGMTEGVVNNDLVTRYFLAHYPEFRLNNRDQRLHDGVRVVPKEYFIVPSFDRRKNFAVHAANNHWKQPGGGIPLARIVRSVMGDVLFYKLVNLRMTWGSEYRALERARDRA